MQPLLAPDLAARRLPVPAWLPPSVAAALTGRTVEVEIPRQVKLRLRSPEKMRVSEWAEAHRVVAEGAHSGPWRHELAPHTVKIMDTYGLPWVREVWFCGVEQSGKTNTMLNCLGWAIDCDPGGIFYLMPTEETAGKVVGGKLRPMLQRSPRLARYLSRRQDDTTLSRITLAHGVTIHPAWANSPASMATWAAKHVFGDEVDKYPPMSGRESDPITLLKKRTRNYKGRYKRFFASTPAGVFIYQGGPKRQHGGVVNCHQVWEYRVRCPECGELVKMDADHLLVPPEATPENVDRLVLGYRCNACEQHWNEQDRESAIRAGRWLCVKGEEIARPGKVGFHHRGWECLDVTLAEIAAAHLKAKSGDLSAKKDWAHGVEAMDYQEELSTRPESAILLLRDDRREAALPAEPIAAISAVADMQKRGFWYTIRAWGYGLEQESWLLKAGFVDSWEALRRLFFESEFTDASGHKHVITLRGMDSGGGESEESELSRTAEAYLFAYQNPGVLLFKGQQRISSPYRVSPQDKLPGTNKALPGGLNLYHLNSTHFKDRLAGKLLINPADPGAWHLHRDTDEEFARQLCVEGKDEHGLWQNPKKKANHYWDCSYMELALVEIHQVKLWAKPETASIQSPPPRRVYSEGVVR